MNSGDGIRLSRRQGLWLHAIACMVFLSGAVAAGCDLLEAAGRELEAGPLLRAGALRVHGGAAMLFLVAVGALIPTHLQRAWTARRNRWSGACFTAVLAALAVTGYGLYYFGGERLREITRWLHLGLGLAEPGLLLLHIFLGRRSRPRMSG